MKSSFRKNYSVFVLKKIKGMEDRVLRLKKQVLSELCDNKISINPTVQMGTLLLKLNAEKGHDFKVS